MNNLKINKYGYLKGVKIIDTDKGKFVVKKNKHCNRELFRYLETKNFVNFVNAYSYGDDYEIYPYVNNINLTDEERALDIVYIISLLHNKTTFYKTNDGDLIKKIYEEFNDKLTYLSNYYDNMKTIIEEEKYTSPSGYLLLRNSTIIYRCIDEAKYFIDKWYQLIKEKKNYRVATCHNNLELDHLLKEDNSYLISWDKACKCSPIYDVLSLYKSVYEKVDFFSLFEIYNTKYPLLEEEIYLLFALMLIPDKVLLSSREIINTKNVYELTNYLMITSNFISNYHSNNSDTKTD